MLMKCGHAANATDMKTGDPCCAICAPDPDAYLPTNSPSYKNRKAICPSCKKTKPSSESLPFFEYRPTMEFDSFYCGCRGWD